VKLLKLAASSIFALAMMMGVWASADEPATRPASDSSEIDGNGPAGNPAQIRRALRALSGRTRGVAPYTQQEWDDMMGFLQKYSPARARVLAGLNVPQNAPIRLDAIRKWRNYNFTKEHFPAIADQLLHRFQLEDELFALMIGAQSHASQLDEFRDKIHDKVAQIVQLDFAERQTRIDRLKKLLDDETQKLSQDQAMEENVIDQRTNTIMSRLEQSSPGVASSTTRPAGQANIRDAADPDQASGPEEDAATPDSVVNKGAGEQAK
jgi:hypothetical protein